MREEQLKALMIDAVDGDACAYDTLLRALLPRLRSFFRRRVGAQEIVEDLVQETLIALHAKRSTFDRAKPFLAWLYAIARYKMSDHFRRSYRIAEEEALDEQGLGDDLEVASLALIDLERLLGILPVKQQLAIRATKIEGLSLAEAATAAGISRSDAKMSVSRGLRRLSARVQGKME